MPAYFGRVSAHSAHIRCYGGGATGVRAVLPKDEHSQGTGEAPRKPHPCVTRAPLTTTARDLAVCLAFLKRT